MLLRSRASAAFDRSRVVELAARVALRQGDLERAGIAVPMHGRDHGFWQLF